jgi:hypothetical protein
MPMLGRGRAVGVGQSGVGVASAALIASAKTFVKSPVIILTGVAAVKIVATKTAIRITLTAIFNVSDKIDVFFGGLSGESVLLIISQVIKFEYSAMIVTNLPSKDKVSGYN